MVSPRGQVSSQPGLLGFQPASALSWPAREPGFPSHPRQGALPSSQRLPATSSPSITTQSLWRLPVLVCLVPSLSRSSDQL